MKIKIMMQAELNNGMHINSQLVEIDIADHIQECTLAIIKSQLAADKAMKDLFIVKKPKYKAVVVEE